MGDYIDRKGLIEALNKFAPEHFNALINQLVTKYPSADVVEVVRCRNCKHAYFKYNCKDTLQEIYACKKRPTGRTHKKVGGDFFCAHGERRDT